MQKAADATSDLRASPHHRRTSKKKQTKSNKEFRFNGLDEKELFLGRFKSFTLFVSRGLIALDRSCKTSHDRYRQYKLFYLNQLLYYQFITDILVSFRWKNEETFISNQTRFIRSIQDFNPFWAALKSTNSNQMNLKTIQTHFLIKPFKV